MKLNIDDISMKANAYYEYHGFYPLDKDRTIRSFIDGYIQCLRDLERECSDGFVETNPSSLAKVSAARTVETINRTGKYEYMTTSGEIYESLGIAADRQLEINKEHKKC